jgi:hypothetical protein
MIKRLLYMISGVSLFLTGVSMHAHLPLAKQLVFFVTACVAFYAGYEAELAEKRANG